ncbi:hypothetical protein F8169_28610 [Bacillus cereus]|nr:hypothetical protein DX930_23805 [Bacillus cereus]KAA6469926.1 hypothetical protein DX931_29545 [Bacillus cereus]KAB2414286.1 hypothetical protein F8169_28610 [Bacillus cereus]KAB2434246.1 hypothetical protein F8166_22400 [Bacillus cereus]KAB2464028.1 hypothetical protein F8164_19635 [Bacillus cereus]
MKNLQHSFFFIINHCVIWTVGALILVVAKPSVFIVPIASLAFVEMAIKCLCISYFIFGLEYKKLIRCSKQTY